MMTVMIKTTKKTNMFLWQITTKCLCLFCFIHCLCCCLLFDNNNDDYDDNDVSKMYDADDDDDNDV